MGINTTYTDWVCVTRYKCASEIENGCYLTIERNHNWIAALCILLGQCVNLQAVARPPDAAQARPFSNKSPGGINTTSLKQKLGSDCLSLKYIRCDCFSTKRPALAVPSPTELSNARATVGSVLRWDCMRTIINKTVRWPQGGLCIQLGLGHLVLLGGPQVEIKRGPTSTLRATEIGHEAPQGRYRSRAAAS